MAQSNVSNTTLSNLKGSIVTNPSKFSHKYSQQLLALLFDAITWPGKTELFTDRIILGGVPTSEGDRVSARTLQTLLALPGLRTILDDQDKMRWTCELAGIEFRVSVDSALAHMELRVRNKTKAQCARHAAALDIAATERAARDEGNSELRYALLKRVMVALNDDQHFGDNVFAEAVEISTLEAALVALPIVPANLCEHFHRKGEMLRATRKPNKYPGALEGKIENIKFRMLPQDDQSYKIVLRGSSRV